ncbi:hypothetical protein HUA74_42655 [Myxococcus sp. CA051A]|uniref:hypothetical protein n=1 Tax=unclassified Myxococcus TaxID=2648731 RepID=UPI00157AC567|nr:MULTISPECIES: hypothetical protein [unclassified Myxococcus]NTX08210.1 hypothetical protein [Myxococcus sp. CA040A]NTX67372.1 hypothetical protein [Myxococcus sp. CA051A]
MDSAALIAIQPTQAVLSPRDPTDDSDWDLDGSVPDVVVELRCPNPGGEPLVTRTPEISSLTPQWTTGGCSVSAELLLTHPIEIKVFDIDTLFDDEVATLSHTLTREELKVGTISVSMSPAINSLTLTFTRAR